MNVCSTCAPQSAPIKALVFVFCALHRLMIYDTIFLMIIFIWDFSPLVVIVVSGVVIEVFDDCFFFFVSSFSHIVVVVLMVLTANPLLFIFPLPFYYLLHPFTIFRYFNTHTHAHSYISIYIWMWLMLI